MFGRYLLEACPFLDRKGRLVHVMREAEGKLGKGTEGEEGEAAVGMMQNK